MQMTDLLESTKKAKLADLYSSLSSKPRRIFSSVAAFLMSCKPSDAEAALAQLIETRTRVEGLTPAVLQEVIGLLQQKEERLTYEVYAILSEAYKHSQATEGLDTALDEAAVLLGSQSSSPRKEDKQISRLAGQHMEVCARIQPARDAAKSLQSAAALEEHLGRAQGLLAKGRMLEAATSITAGVKQQEPNSTGCELETELLEKLAAEAQALAEMKSTDDSKGSDGLETIDKLYTSIRNTIPAFPKRLSEVIMASFRCSTTDSGNLRLEVDPQANLREAWEALLVLAADSSVHGQLSSQFLEALLLPTARARKATARLLGRSHTDWHAVEIDIAEPEEGLTPETALLEVFKFISEHIFLGRSILQRRLGEVVWTPVARTLILQRLQAVVPDSDQAFAAFESLAQPAMQLEADLEREGFLDPAGKDASRPISAFVSHSSNKWLQKKRLQLVEEARAIILSPDYDTLRVGQNLTIPAQAASSEPQDMPAPDGDTALLGEGIFQISRTGDRILQLLRRGLSQAAEASSSAVAQATLLSLRDIAALYSALPPVTQQRELQVPQLAALHRNDCFYIAQQLITLPHCYPALQAQHGVVPRLWQDADRLRATGKTCLMQMAEQQGKEIQELLAGADSFTRVHKAQQGIKARKAIQQVLHLLRRLGGVLRPVLPLTAFAEFGTVLLGVGAGKVLGDILSLSDISVEESEDLPKILEPFAEEACTNFVGTSTSKEVEESRRESDYLLQQIQSSTPALSKLKEVIELLSARLADIQQRWQSGKLQRLGFTAAETELLIVALFEDTDLRREVISTLKLPRDEG